MAKPDHSILPDKQSWKGKRIGLLGGSFNPAHAGHLEISLCALSKLGLDAVWWLVSPQNPLKSVQDMASLDERMVGAEKMATDPRIHVSDLEKQLATSYTVDFLNKITKLAPDTCFIWLMGADNLAQFSKWKDWKEIGKIVAFAIFDRPSYSSAVETSEAAAFFKDNQIPEDNAYKLGTEKLPAWTFIREVQNEISSSHIRQKKL